MSYPFSGNRQSQSAYSQGYPTTGTASAGAAADDYYGGGYDDDDHHHRPQAYPSRQYTDDDDVDPTTAYNTATNAQQQQQAYPTRSQAMSGTPGGYNEKVATPGSGVGGIDDPTYASYGTPRRGGANRDSIFSQQDRHVFFRRSIPVRALRSIFCILLWTLILIITVILLVVLFARPPNIALLSIDPPTANDFDVSGSSFTANGSVNFAVSNPNSFSATITHLNAHLYDANLPNDVSIGNGTLKDQKIKANDNTTVVFPFTLGIDLANGAEALIQDVVTSCGLGSGGSGTGNLNVRLAIDAHISVLSVGVSVPINRNISVECPTNQLEGVIKSITGAVGDIGSAISSILGGGSSKRDGLDGVAAVATPLPRSGGDDDEAKLLAVRDAPVQLDLLSRREVLQQLVEPWFGRAAAGSDLAGKAVEL